MENMPVYREPKEARSSKRSRRLLFLIFLFFITILIILFFDSSLSKITSIEVSGNRYLDTDMIVQLSGVVESDPYFLVFTSRVTEKIMELPEVKQVQVKKQFPGKLMIQVEEYQEVALEIAADGTLQLVLENGNNIPLTQQQLSTDLPIIRQWDDDPELRLKLVQQLAKIELHHLADISEIHRSPSRSYPDRIKIYTRSQFEVITSISHLPDKLPLLEDVIYKFKQSGHTTGEITMLEGISGKSFELELMENLEE